MRWGRIELATAATYHSGRASIQLIGPISYQNLCWRGWFRENGMSQDTAVVNQDWQGVYYCFSLFFQLTDVGDAAFGRCYALQTSEGFLRCMRAFGDLSS